VVSSWTDDAPNLCPVCGEDLGPSDDALCGNGCDECAIVLTWEGNGLIVAVGAMLERIGWLLESVTNGEWRPALQSQLNAHDWALSATDWAERIVEAREKQWAKESRDFAASKGLN
jgi:hypothetical protein